MAAAGECATFFHTDFPQAIITLSVLNPSILMVAFPGIKPLPTLLSVQGLLSGKMNVTGML